MERRYCKAAKGKSIAVEATPPLKRIRAPTLDNSLPDSISLNSSLMASPSSSKPGNYKYKVFCSFHGLDVRKTFLSHLREQFNRNGITTFDDQEMKRGGDLSPSLIEAIKESRISIVILSQRYASSSWCLDELVEILKRKNAMKQIVMTVFHGVEPSDVRKQTGDFGIAFEKTCANKTDKERLEWSTALTDVSNIAGEDPKNWDNEANMIKKIARDVSAQLNATPSKDFYGKVGLETHLREMESLLDLDNVAVKIVGISGPPGIGKTTIAIALQSLLSDRFQFTCFMDLGGSDPSGLHNYGMQLGSDPSGLHNYGMQLRLQKQLLSKLLNQDDMRICHLEVLPQRLCDQRVLIILDDVNDVMQLKVLAKETTWFGPGSRIIVTTEDKKILQQHGINNTYHVGFPSTEAALEIFCQYAFEQSSPPHGFKELAERTTYLCGNLPLGLSVMGSSLIGMKQDEWECVMQRLETNPGIVGVLRVSYERLHENDQMLFLHIAVFFNYRNGDLVKTMFANSGLYVNNGFQSDLEVNCGLKNLENRSLISTYGDQIRMHRLLQQVGKIAIHEQKASKRQILIDADEICDVLEEAKGTRAVSGISFDISNIDKVSISKKTFKRMPNLRFLRIYKSRYDGNYRMDIPDEMEFPHHLRLLEWEAYPNKSLPPRFNPEYLVELSMRNSQLVKLWEGIQPLKNLKKMELSASKNLKELPDLSNATNLEILDLSYCESLVEIPSSISHLHKLKWLWMNYCINLQVIPAHINLASLKSVYMVGCTRLRNIPLLSTNIRLLNLSYSDIERIPDCIKALHNLLSLNLGHCRRLTSLPALPGSLISLYAEDCESLETLPPLSTPKAEINFTNCIKLGQQAHIGIIQRSFCCRTTILPGREVPAEFDNRARGSSLTIVLDGNSSYTRFVFCVVISPNQPIPRLAYPHISWRRIIAQDDGYPVEGCVRVGNLNKFRTEHLLIFHHPFGELIYRPEVSREMMFEFSIESRYLEVIECGAKILTQEESFEWRSDQASEDDIEFEPSEEAFEDDIEPSEEAFEDKTEYGDPTNIDGEKQTDSWSWFFLCFGLFDLFRGRRR